MTMITHSGIQKIANLLFGIDSATARRSHSSDDGTHLLVHTHWLDIVVVDEDDDAHSGEILL